MKTVIYFIITLCISCGCLIAATNMKTPFPLFLIGFGLWVLFFWGWHRRQMKKAEKHMGEQRFQEYMRGKLRNIR